MSNPVTITNHQEPGVHEVGSKVTCGGITLLVFKHRYQISTGVTGSPIDLADLEAAVAAAVELQRTETV